MKGVVSVILAGGEGTRLFPLTRHRCKPDVCFAGRYRLIDVPLSSSIHSKIGRIFVLTQHLADSLHDHIFTTYSSPKLSYHKIELLPSIGRCARPYQGTADAIRQNVQCILSSSVEYVLILAGDQLYDIDFHDLVEFAKKTDADLTIATLPVDEKDARRMGLLKVNALGAITDFYEKPQDEETLKRFVLPQKPDSSRKYLGSMGIYVFKKQALVSLLQNEGNDFGKHIIPIQVKQGRAFAYIYNGYWEDIGTVSAYYRANLALTEESNWLQNCDRSRPIFTPVYHLSTPIIRNAHIENSLINLGCQIEGNEILKSVVGMQVRVQKETSIHETVIMGDSNPERSVMIGSGCKIQNAIVDSDVVIGDRVRLTNEKKLQSYDGDGVMIRDGIIIVTTHSRIRSGFEL